MDKTLFCDSIRALQAQYEHDNEWSAKLAALFPDERVFGIYNNSKITIALLHILQLEMDDAHEHSWIEYFCYELDFGKEYRAGCATDNGKNIDLSSPETLFDYLKSIKKCKTNEKPS